jgi:hypothetical protein
MKGLPRRQKRFVKANVRRDHFELLKKQIMEHLRASARGEAPKAKKRRRANGPR